MKNNNLLQSCFFIDRSGLRYFEYGAADVVELKLSSEIVVDLELISESSLERVLKNWIDQLKLTPGITALLYDGSICFQKQLEHMPEDVEADPKVKDYLGIVPFTEVEYKIFPMESGAVLTVLNKNLIKPLIHVLEKVGFKVICLSPAFILGVDFTKSPFSKEIAAPILDRLDFLNSYSLISKEEAESKITEEKPFMSIKITPKIIAMAAVFVVLIIILALLLFLQNK